LSGIARRRARRKGNNPATLLRPHQGCRRPDDTKGAAQVHVDHRIPFLNTHVEEHAVPQNPCHVYHNVQLAERIQGRLHHGLPAFRHGHGVIVCHCRAAGIGNLFDHQIGRRVCPPRAIHRHSQVVHHHFGAFLGKEFAYFPPNAVAAASNHCHFVLQNHRCPSSARARARCWLDASCRACPVHANQETCGFCALYALRLGLSSAVGAGKQRKRESDFAVFV
jgi:hypothetical protein